MTNQKKIQVGEVYTVKDVEADPSRFIGAEIKVYWTATSFAQMTLGLVTKDDEGFTIFSLGVSETGEAIVESYMRVAVLAIKDNGMPTVKGAIVTFGEGTEQRIFFAERAPKYPGEEVFLETKRRATRSWISIMAIAAGRQIFVSEPSWEKVGE